MPEIPATDWTGFWVRFVKLEKWGRMAVVSRNSDQQFDGKSSFCVDGGGFLMEFRGKEEEEVGKKGSDDVLVGFNSWSNMVKTWVNES